MVAVIESFGKIDVLVNNAGLIWGEHAENMPLQKWRMVLDVNLTGAFLFCKPAGRRMIERGLRRIINIASINGTYGRTASREIDEGSRRLSGGACFDYITGQTVDVDGGATLV